MSTAQGERRLYLQSTRAALCRLPVNEFFEIPGRPNVIYQLREYGSQDSGGAAQARLDVPFLFKAFETGQIGPKRLAKMHGGKAKARTIHEYLDWTVTENKATDDDELDFYGFRVIILLPRYCSQWPPPTSVEPPDPQAGAPPRPTPKLGAPLSPLPFLQSHGKPLSAATIRSGPDYLEVPFVATHENKRGRGHGRALLEAMEDVARALKLPRLLLCSTNDKGVRSTWEHLGLQVSSEEYLAATDVQETDLVHMLHTTQMHKEVGPRRQFRPVIIRHERFVQRTYASLDASENGRHIGAGPLSRATIHDGTPSTSRRYQQCGNNVAVSSCQTQSEAGSHGSARWAMRACSEVVTSLDHAGTDEDDNDSSKQLPCKRRAVKEEQGEQIRYGIAQCSGTQPGYLPPGTLPQQQPWPQLPPLAASPHQAGSGTEQPLTKPLMPPQSSLTGPLLASEQSHALRIPISGRMDLLAPASGDHDCGSRKTVGCTAVVNVHCNKAALMLPGNHIRHLNKEGNGRSSEDAAQLITRQLHESAVGAPRIMPSDSASGTPAQQVGHL